MGRGGAPLLLLLCVVTASLAARVPASTLHHPASGADEAFIGWRGESYRPQGDGQPHQHQQGSAVSAAAEKKQWIEVVSWRPRAFIYHNFLSDEEAAHIKRLSAPSMKRSTVVAMNGSSVLDDYRTSYGTFIKRKADATLEAIEARIAHWARIPAINGEDMQVLRYGLGQQYKPHMDVLNAEEAGPRVATVLLYLNDVEEGGETAFPDSNHWVDKSLPERLGPFSPCARGSVAFKPKKNDALMFWSVHADARRQDDYAMHTGCPVLKGVKWTATKWIHSRPFRPGQYGNLTPYDAIDPGLCEDHDASCADWAKKGECARNAKFMTGDVGSAGRCPRACGTCTPCKPGDKACYDANRARAGYLVFDDADLDSDAHAARVLQQQGLSSTKGA